MEHYSLHKLKDMIYSELDRIAMKSEFTPESLCLTDHLTHSLKSILAIEKANEMESEMKEKEETIMTTR